MRSGVSRIDIKRLAVWALEAVVDLLPFFIASNYVATCDINILVI